MEGGLFGFAFVRARASPSHAHARLSSRLANHKLVDLQSLAAPPAAEQGACVRVCLWGAKGVGVSRCVWVGVCSQHKKTTHYFQPPPAAPRPALLSVYSREFHELHRRPHWRAPLLRADFLRGDYCTGGRVLDFIAEGSTEPRGAPTSPPAEQAQARVLYALSQRRDVCVRLADVYA